MNEEKVYTESQYLAYGEAKRLEGYDNGKLFMAQQFEAQKQSGTAASQVKRWGDLVAEHVGKVEVRKVDRI
jgi:hypothetical protein